MQWLDRQYVPCPGSKGLTVNNNSVPGRQGVRMRMFFFAIFVIFLYCFLKVNVCGPLFLLKHNVIYFFQIFWKILTSIYIVRIRSILTASFRQVQVESIILLIVLFLLHLFILLRLLPLFLRLLILIFFFMSLCLSTLVVLLLPLLISGGLWLGLPGALGKSSSPFQYPRSQYFNIWWSQGLESASCYNLPRGHFLVRTVLI